MDTIYLQEGIIESKSTTRNVISNTIRYFIAVELSFSKGRYFRDGGEGGWALLLEFYCFRRKTVRVWIERNQRATNLIF